MSVLPDLIDITNDYHASAVSRPFRQSTAESDVQPTPQSVKLLVDTMASTCYKPKTHVGFRPRGQRHDSRI